MRARYWDDALQVWKWDRLKGVGADTFGTARRPLQKDQFRADHAHGYIPQTLADLGLLGLGVNLLLLIAWLGAAARATGLKPPWRIGAWTVAALRARSVKVPLARRAPQPWSAERIGLVAIALSAVAFGLHSAIDWTWFIHGTALVGLLCAGWVAGRGPLSEPLPRLRAPRLPAAAPRAALAATVVAAGLVAAWTTWQPLRAQQAYFDAVDALDAGRPAQARADARRSIDLNPLSVTARLKLAEIEQTDGRPAEARAIAQHAVELQPANRDAWLTLGQLLLEQGDAERAVAALNAAVFLDPRSPATQLRLHEAQTQAGVSAAPPADPTAPPADPTAPPAGATPPPDAP
nr:tetratricopeptide repeat protein [Conexibacter arvalis]